MKSHHVFIFTLFSSASAFSTTKFVEWFPQSMIKLRAAWRGPCKPIYDDFVYKGQGQCGPVLDCLLEYGTSELRKTTIAAAQVTLGLIPTLLSCVGNSVPATYVDDVANAGSTRNVSGSTHTLRESI